MRVLVCGSRTYTNARRIRQVLSELPRGAVVIHGGARGADRIADGVARSLGFTVMEFKPDWSRGRHAGFDRNLAMLDEQPDRVIAFWDWRSRGTAHTIGEALKRGILVEVIE